MVQTLTLNASNMSFYYFRLPFYNVLSTIEDYVMLFSHILIKRYTKTTDGSTVNIYLSQY